MANNGILHMRIGPGKHMHGMELMGGALKGEEFDVRPVVPCHIYADC
jgi:hypothetical protein